MDDAQKKELTERFNQLPKGLREAIGRIDSSSAIQEIVQKYKMALDDRDTLRRETALVLFGDTKTEDFAFCIEEALPLWKSEASAIARTIDKSMFEGLRPSIQALQQGPTEEAEQELDESEDGDTEEEIGIEPLRPQAEGTIEDLLPLGSLIPNALRPRIKASIVEEKLRTPTSAAPVETALSKAMEESHAQAPQGTPIISSPSASASPQPPASPRPILPPSPPPSRLRGDDDPYREKPE